MNNISRLFIIGNGFDKAHKFHTSYFDFRLWMEEKLSIAFPELRRDTDNHLIVDEAPEIPEVSMGNHGEEIVDENQSLYLLMWMLLNNVPLDVEWNKFEKVLYDLDLEAVISENDWFIESNARDKEGDINPFYVDSNYSELASDLKASVLLLPKLFSKWIEDVEIPEKGFFKEEKYGFGCFPISSETLKKMNDEALYLSLNYTETLEKIYDIPGCCVDHIHGLRIKGFKYYDPSSVFPDTKGHIIVGHGVDESRDFDDEYIEKESILQETIRSLRKPVDKLVKEHRKFWSCIRDNDIKEVYSFGFSYEEVDVPYIREIVRNLNVPKSVTGEPDIQNSLQGNGGSRNVTWYLHKHGDKNDDNIRYEKIIRDCGFMGSFGRFE